MDLVPICLHTDSYKTTHPFQYPGSPKKYVAYGEFRSSYERDAEDHRIVFYGIRYIIEKYVSRKWTIEDLKKSEEFLSTHNAGYEPFPFPKDLFLKFIKENNGFFPVKIEALPEGSVIYPHVPVYVITAEKEYAKLVTYLETILTMIWYPTTVATLSRRCKKIISDFFNLSVDSDSFNLLERFNPINSVSRLHDFGYRGCTCNEQAIIGGTAHLLNFIGTDTMPAAYYAQYYLNNGLPVGCSIPATEHSVMTSFVTEKAAIEHMIDRFGSGAYSIVMDSYDYKNALENILPTIASKKVGKGGFLVLRPDSGDPSTVVLMALQYLLRIKLRSAEKVFGAKINSKGYKVLCGCGVIQGDGIHYNEIKNILECITSNGYSAQNVAFGMGGGLLQRVNRDTMNFATKLSFVEFEDGTKRDIMKIPKLDSKKISLPGEFKVIKNQENLPVVFPKEDGRTLGENMLRVVYDNGSIPQWSSFHELRTRVESEWSISPKQFDPISQSLQNKIFIVKEEIEKRLELK